MKLFSVLLPILFLFLFCTRRDGGIGTRNNPFDPGGSDWTVNAAPEVSAAGDSLWTDFNHTAMTGTMRLNVTVSDKNFPYDTISGTLRGTEQQCTFSSLHESSPDTSFILSGLRAGTAYRCTVAVIDLKDGTDTGVLSLVTPSGIPPQPPVPFVSSTSSGISISWDTVAGADRYVLYAAPERYGPYHTAAALSQNYTTSRIAVVDTPSGGYSPVYYRLAVGNSYGTSLSTDTLIGRVYNGSLPSPSVEASKGSYAGCINVLVGYNKASICQCIELYRRVGTSGEFGRVATLYPTSKSTGSSIQMVYLDSVTTADTCYYRASLIDFTEYFGPLVKSSSDSRNGSPHHPV